MRVFVTGATGFVGSAIVAELIGAGHGVVGLARSEKAASALAAAGAEALRGDLGDLESLRAGAADSEGVIHTAFQNIGPGTDFAAACEADRRAVAALGDGLAGTGRPLVVTSGTMMVASSRTATEEDAPRSNANPRAASEESGLEQAARDIRASIVRLSPSVHGDGDHGFVPALIGTARARGVSAYVDDGRNRWPGVHRLDAARLFRLVLEKGTAGSRYHGVADEGVPFRDIAGVIGRCLGVPVVSVSQEEAAAHFTYLAHFVRTDNPTSSALTQMRLGWHPEGVSLLEDIANGAYFAG